MKCPHCLKYGINDDMGVWTGLDGKRRYVCNYCNNILSIDDSDSKMVVKGDKK